MRKAKVIIPDISPEALADTPRLERAEVGGAFRAQFRRYCRAGLDAQLERIVCEPPNPIAPEDRTPRLEAVVLGIAVTAGLCFVTLFQVIAVAAK